MPEPRRFRTLEQLNEHYAVQFSRVALEPAPLVRKRRQAELLIERDEALRTFRYEQEVDAAALDAALTPRTPRPEPEPLPATATDDERAERLYGDARLLGRTIPAAPPPTTPAFTSVEAIRKHFGKQRKAAGDDTDAIQALGREEEEALAAFAAADEAAAKLYGGPILAGRGEWKNPYVRAQSDYPPTPGEPDA